MRKIWNTHFRDVAFSKNTNFSKCSECIVLKAQMKSATTKELEERARGRLNKHNKTIMCGRYCYYAHIIMSEWFPKEYLSIIHDKMDKTKTSIPRLRVKSKSIVGTNLGLSLTGMLTHGHNTRGFGHFSLPFVHMGSQFTITSLAKCWGTLKNHTLICMVIYFMRLEVQETHFQMHYLTLAFIQNVECTRMIFYLMEDQKVRMLILDLFLHIYCYSWTMQRVIIRIVTFSCFYHF